MDQHLMRILNDSTDTKRLLCESQSRMSEREDKIWERRKDTKKNMMEPNVTESRWYNVWLKYRKYEAFFERKKASFAWISVQLNITDTNKGDNNSHKFIRKKTTFFL